MHRVSSGRVPNGKLPLFSPVSSGTHPPNTLICENRVSPIGKLIDFSV